MHHFEKILSDNHFIGDPFINKFIDNGNLSFEQCYFNAVQSHYRARVEHCISRFAKFHTISQTWRGSYERLKICSFFVANIVAVERRFNLRYPPFGPYPHRYEPNYF